MARVRQVGERKVGRRAPRRGGLRGEAPNRVLPMALPARRVREIGVPVPPVAAAKIPAGGSRARARSNPGPERLLNEVRQHSGRRHLVLAGDVDASVGRILFRPVTLHAD